MSFLNEFSIQGGNPEVTGEFDEYDSLSLALARVFKFPTEHLIIFWQDCYVPICYTYELPRMIPDLLPLLRSLAEEETGTKVVHWAPDTFRSTWSLSWEGDALLLAAKWSNVQGHCLSRLNQLPPVNLTKTQFLGEWKRPLVIVLDGLVKSGYCEQILPEMSALKETISMISTDGVHYRDLRSP